MKIKILLIPFLLFSTLLNLKAQSVLKIGHVNVQELVQKHPDMDSIRALVEKETKDMQDIYDEMMAEHEIKLSTFEKESGGYSDFIKETKQKEIMELAQKIKEYNASAQQQLQQRNMELIQPVYRDINQQISNIAGYDKFSYILDVSTGVVAYVSPESVDITPKVLEAISGK